MSHTLPSLPYAYDALEPAISKQIMEIHHKKHHQTYVNALNAAEAAYGKAASAKERIALQQALKFNGGGHINHSLFWLNLAPTAAKGGNGGVLPEGPLKQAILDRWANVETFQKEFSTTTAGVQGSGWGWLGWNAGAKKLEIVTTANQDPLITHIPIIGVDVWEHAYYLQYLNVRPDYLAAIWQVINWETAEKRFIGALDNIDAASKL